MAFTSQPASMTRFSAVIQTAGSTWWPGIPRIIWPDGIFADDRYVYCVLVQWNRLPGFNGEVNLGRPPYLLIRVPTSTAEERP